MEAKKDDLLIDEMEQSQEEESDIQHKIWKKKRPLFI